MFLEGDLRLCMPDLTFLRREVLPGESNDLGECAVVRLDVGRNVLVLDKRGPEEDKRIGRPGNVVLWLLLCVTTSASR